MLHSHFLEQFVWRPIDGSPFFIRSDFQVDRDPNQPNFTITFRPLPAFSFEAQAAEDDEEELSFSAIVRPGRHLATSYENIQRVDDLRASIAIWLSNLHNELEVLAAHRRDFHVASDVERAFEHVVDLASTDLDEIFSRDEGEAVLAQLEQLQSQHQELQAEIEILKTQVECFSKREWLHSLVGRWAKWLRKRANDASKTAQDAATTAEKTRELIKSVAVIAATVSGAPFDRIEAPTNPRVEGRALPEPGVEQSESVVLDNADEMPSDSP